MWQLISENKYNDLLDRGAVKESRTRAYGLGPMFWAYKTQEKMQRVSCQKNYNNNVY
jgi:hypothetical protein